MSKEQIEKMAKGICLATQKTNYSCAKICEKQGSCAYCIVMAEHLYNADYRKQSEGEWIAKNHSYYCSECDGEHGFAFCKGSSGSYCPNCGAKMKGGAE